MSHSRTARRCARSRTANARAARRGFILLTVVAASAAAFLVTLTVVVRAQAEHAGRAASFDAAKISPSAYAGAAISPPKIPPGETCAFHACLPLSRSNAAYTPLLTPTPTSSLPPPENTFAVEPTS